MMLAPLAAEWGLAGVTVLIDVPMVWSVEIMIWVALLVLILPLPMYLLFRGNPGMHDRIRRGPDHLLKSSYWVLGGAMVSQVGGMLLMARGYETTAWFIQSMSTFVALCEIYALVGSIFLAGLLPEPEQEELATDVRSDSSPAA